MKLKNKEMMTFLVIFLLCGWIASGFSVLAEKITVSETDLSENVPEIFLHEPIGENKYYDSEKDIYWFSDSQITISVTIAGEEENSYRVIYSTDAQFENFEELITDSQAATIVRKIEHPGKVVIYYLKCIDQFGNESTVRKVNIGVDDTPAEITDVIFTQSNGDEWINAEEFSGASKVAFSVTAEDEETGIQTIEYSSDDGKNYQEADFAEQNGVYTFVTNESFQDSADYRWRIRVTNNVKCQSEKILSEWGKVDTKPPERNAYIKFISDVVGENDPSRGNIINNQWSSNLYEMEDEEWNKICARNELRFQVYVKDATSGIDSIIMSYNGKTIPAEELKLITENMEIVEGYTAFEGIIKNYEHKEAAVRNFQIDCITDVAGNRMQEKIVLGCAEDEDLIYMDATAPVLTNYQVSHPTSCRINEIPIYKNVLEEDDVIVDFTIEDDFLTYIPENLIVSIYCGEEKEPVYAINGNDFSIVDDLEEAKTPAMQQEGQKQYYKFSFDGQENDSNEYSITISYKDGAGNKLTGSDSMPCVDGVYQSEKIVIDHKQPEFSVEYVTDAVNVITLNGANAVNDSKKPLADHIAYYNQAVEILLAFQEENAHQQANHALEHFEFVMKKDGKEIQAPDIEWSHTEKESFAKFIIPEEDGNYQFEVKYCDCAENLMISNEEGIQKLIEDGCYRSPVLVIDTTAPKVMTKYMADLASVYEEKDYFRTPAIFKIMIEDRNIRYGELKEGLNKFTAKDISGQEIQTSLTEQLNVYEDTKIWCVNGETEYTSMTLDLKLLKAAHYSIPVYFTDLAGNAAIVNQDIGGYIEHAVIDTTIPEIELLYSTLDAANYREWGYLFAKDRMTVTAKVKDFVAGVQAIKFTITDEYGKKTVKIKSFEPKGEAEYSVEIPVSENDFKGSVLAEVVDYSKNKNSKIRSHIIESSSTHSKTGKAEIITLTSPARTVNGVDFYNTDVAFKILLQDTYSGIGKWEYQAGNALHDSVDYKVEAGADLSKIPSADIIHRVERKLLLDAKQNNQNNVFLKAGFFDNVGYSLFIEKEYNIDITKPVITVEYDLNEPVNGRYYNETRTATVKIKERNFCEEDVQFLFTSTDGPKPEISGWTHSGSGDDAVHICTVKFSQDSDYTFTIKFMDMAGNTADYHRVDDFTIDKTKPVVTVTYDNNSYLNEYYYKKARTAIIDIVEHNFEPSAIEIMMTASGNTEGTPRISAWTSNGEHHIATISFSTDGEYTFDIAGADLALNELNDYPADYFVIDQTAPELEIFDIGDRSANNGVVRPGIRCFDVNYNAGSEEFLLEGYHNGVIQMAGEQSTQNQGFVFRADDFAYVQESDDLYTLNAVVYDLAGNRSEAMIRFSVNRFGSVYTFDRATEDLVGAHGKYYTNKEQKLVVTETNVDSLEFREITLNRNGKLTTLKEGEDYAVSYNGSETSWKQYTYTFEADNFIEEGSYILTIYSEDRAENTSDNQSKGKKIEFTVDKTNPSILISGVENGGQYRTNSKEITVNLEDNISVAQALVTINGVEMIYDAAQLHESEGRLLLKINSENQWQDIRVVATDAAGNITSSEEIKVLVTANVLVQFFMNKPLFYSVFGVSILVAGYALRRKWKISRERS
ncbi:MAG: hypothetical protein IJ024_01835 [Lachnospiraceae bacterium]|nr:hypothetical protein [Lachnospiraceae bacterium]